MVNHLSVSNQRWFIPVSTIINIVLSLMLISNLAMGMDTPPSGVLADNEVPKKRRTDSNGTVPVNDPILVNFDDLNIIIPLLSSFGPHRVCAESMELNERLEEIPRPQARRAGEMSTTIPLSAVSRRNQREPNVSEVPLFNSKDSSFSRPAKP